jgi:hypothetical protein
MKPLLNFLFKGIVFITLGNIVCISLYLLALIMWDSQYMKASSDIWEQFWSKN